MSFETTALLLTWVAITLLALVVAGLVRQVHALGQGYRASGEAGTALGLTPGSVAPDFERLAAPGPADTLLLFLSEDCGSCDGVLESLSSERLPHPVRALFGTKPLDLHTPDGIDVYPDEERLFDAYRVPATPFAVVVDSSGRVRASEPVGSPRSLRDLLDRLGEEN